MTPPTIARGDVRECLSGLIAQAADRAAVDPDPVRRRRHRKLWRYLVQRLACVILAEAGRL